jgi:hypothetical protein
LKIIVKYDFIALPYQKKNNEHETNFNNPSTYLPSMKIKKISIVYQKTIKLEADIFYLIHKSHITYVKSCEEVMEE